MQFRVALATAVDVSFIAAALGYDDEHPSGDGASALSIEHLLGTCRASTQVWVARNLSGEPCVLWGVLPAPDDDQVGHMWMLATEVMDSEVLELATLTKLVVTQMLEPFAQLENYVDVTKERAMALLKHVGFHIDPPRNDVVSGQSRSRVWINATDLSVSFGQSSRYAPN